MERKTVFNNFLWRFLERTGAQGVNFVVSLVLARLLDPTIYGTVALISVFTAILQVFIDSGFGSALVQKKGADDLDFSSVFFFNVLLCFGMYALLFLAAPLIAGFYNQGELTTLIRVQGLLLIISGLKNVQQAYVTRNMMFKRFFFATLGGTIGAAVVGIWMALTGFGVWALVAQSLFNATVDTIILWRTVPWRPKRMFSADRLKKLLQFGWKVLASRLLNTVYGNLYNLIIGKMYRPEALAYYNRASVFPASLIQNINSSIDSVLLPVMASVQDDRASVRGMTRRAIKTSSYIIFPAMMGLAACSEPLIRFILTEKWLPCVPFMRIFCITYAFMPIHTANLNAITALGRSDIFLKLEVIKKITGLIVLVSTMWFGVMAMAYSLLLVDVLGQIINTWPNRKLLDYAYEQQLRDICPAMILSVLMGVCVWAITLLGFSDLVTLLIQVPVGVVIYVACSAIFRLESFSYLLGFVKSYLRKEK